MDINREEHVQQILKLSCYNIKMYRNKSIIPRNQKVGEAQDIRNKTTVQKGITVNDINHDLQATKRRYNSIYI
jgi:hypothetical protein